MIRPTRPFEPRSLTKAMMFVVTLPKNGKLRANQKRKHDRQRQQHQPQFGQRADPVLDGIDPFHCEFSLGTAPRFEGQHE